MRKWMAAAGLLVVMATEASAYDGFSPLSGPNTAIPSPVCDVINFGFCPQPPSRAIDVPDPNEIAQSPLALPPPEAKRRPVHHRRRVPHPAD